MTKTPAHQDYGVFIIWKDGAKGWLTPDFATNRLKIHAARYRKQADAEQVAKGIIGQAHDRIKTAEARPL